MCNIRKCPGELRPSTWVVIRAANFETPLAGSFKLELAAQSGVRELRPLLRQTIIQSDSSMWAPIIREMTATSDLELALRGSPLLIMRTKRKRYKPEGRENGVEAMDPGQPEDQGLHTLVDGHWLRLGRCVRCHLGLLVGRMKSCVFRGALKGNQEANASPYKKKNLQVERLLSPQLVGLVLMAVF